MIARLKFSPILSNPCIGAKSHGRSGHRNPPSLVLIGLGFEFFRELMLDFRTAGTSLSTLYDKSVFTYLEEQRKNPSAQQG